MRLRPTRAEEILWDAVRANRVDGHHFRRQHVVGRFIVDFYCRSAALVIEVDGEEHARSEVRDHERDVVLHAKGFDVVRFSNRDVETDLTGVLKRIRECLRKK
ncbi:MAG: endonuclease domain-containing protein [Thermoanaerobaculia bacterium]